MVKSLVIRGVKVKTGCATCRIRRVKCDENKPFCKKCVSTGRTCDGYESSFKVFTKPSIDSRAHVDAIKSYACLGFVRPNSTEIGGGDVDLLNRYFSTKTLFDVKLDCEEEARQILQASLTDTRVRDALVSLRVLRDDLEAAGDSPASIAKPTPSHNYGLQQYGMALGGLASDLSSTGSYSVRSALLCCQIFVSIEQVRKNYGTMAQHIIRGLRIMHEYCARPYFVATKRLVPAHYEKLPLLDIFVIKMFAAPCKFKVPKAADADAEASSSSASPDSLCNQPVESHNLPLIVPCMKTQLRKIAASTIRFLDQVSQVESVENATLLLSEKAALLKSLDTWLMDLESIQNALDNPGPEPLLIPFFRMFHLILEIVVLGALDSSPDLDAKLQMESDRLQSIANDVGEMYKTYVTCSGKSDGSARKRPRPR